MKIKFSRLWSVGPILRNIIHANEAKKKKKLQYIFLKKQEVPLVGASPSDAHGKTRDEKQKMKSIKNHIGQSQKNKNFFA